MRATDVGPVRMELEDCRRMLLRLRMDERRSPGRTAQGRRVPAWAALDLRTRPLRRLMQRTLNDRDYQIVEMYYLDGQEERTIADRLHYADSTVHHAKINAVKLLEAADPTEGGDGK